MRYLIVSDMHGNWDAFEAVLRKVRRKLATCAPGWTYVHTHFGVGYRFSPERVTSP